MSIRHQVLEGRTPTRVSCPVVLMAYRIDLTKQSQVAIAQRC